MNDRPKKRKSLKKTLLTKIIIFVAILIVVITQITIKLAADNIQSLTNNILARESATYASEIHNWWSGVEERVSQTAEICMKDMEACLSGVAGANASFDKIYGDVEKATEGITEIASGVQRINDVASNNAATTEEQASNIAEVLELSSMIVSESNKLRSESENITSISENLNQYSDEINSDLSQYTV